MGVSTFKAIIHNIMLYHMSSFQSKLCTVYAQIVINNHKESPHFQGQVFFDLVEPRVRRGPCSKP